MNTPNVIRSSAVLLILFTATAARAQEPAKPERERDSVCDAALVERLGDSRFSVREQATRELQDRGRAALPALRSGAKSADLEIRRRCEFLLKPLLRAEVERVGTGKENSAGTPPSRVGGDSQSVQRRPFGP